MSLSNLSKLYKWLRLLILHPYLSCKQMTEIYYKSPLIQVHDELELKSHLATFQNVKTVQ